MKTILVTGSSGLIGSEAVEHFDRQGHQVIGVVEERGTTVWTPRRRPSSIGRR